jgi:hypothetical protein
LVEGESGTSGATEGGGETSSSLVVGDIGRVRSSRASGDGDVTSMGADSISDLSASEASLGDTRAGSRGASSDVQESLSNVGSTVTSEGSSVSTIVIEGPHLNQIILENPGEDEGMSVRELLDSLDSGGNDQVINGGVEVSLISRAEAQRTRASVRGDSTDGTGGEGDAINVDSGSSSVGGTIDQGIVRNNNGEIVPLVLEEDTLGIDGGRANSEPDLSQTVVRVLDELELDQVGARAVGKDATSKGASIYLDFEGETRSTT